MHEFHSFEYGRKPIIVLLLLFIPKNNERVTEFFYQCVIRREDMPLEIRRWINLSYIRFEKGISKAEDNSKSAHCDVF